MKKIISFFLTLCLLACTATLLFACKTNRDQQSDKVTVVTTIFPIYDWVKNVGGEHVDAVLLVDNGSDLHSFQPTVKDIATIARCDLFVYVGGESDGWVHDALKTTGAPALNLLEALGEKALVEELPEGAEEEEHHHEQGDEDHEDGEEEEYDEHVWLSIKNASHLVGSIGERLQTIDSEHFEEYKQNVQRYQAELSVLDAQYAQAVSKAPYKTLLFGDRFPFRYLADDYDIEVFAAFSGCSAESEASFETIVFLANKLDELDLPAIVKLESSDGKIANTIKQNSTGKDQAVVTLDSMQSTTLFQANAGKNYMQTMQQNLIALSQALGKEEE